LGYIAIGALIILIILAVKADDTSAILEVIKAIIFMVIGALAGKRMNGA